MRVSSRAVVVVALVTAWTGSATVSVALADSETVSDEPSPFGEVIETLRREPALRTASSAGRRTTDRRAAGTFARADRLTPPAILVKSRETFPVDEGD